MSIQSEINQGLALTSLIFNQNPLAAAGRRKGEAKTMSKATDEYAASRVSAINGIKKPYVYKLERIAELQGELSNRRKAELELDPTPERGKEYEDQVKREFHTKSLLESVKKHAKDAAKSLREEQDSKRLTTQNFTPAMSDDVKNSEVYFGKTSLGKVKDLKPTLQQSISNELAKEEKKSE